MDLAAVSIFMVEWSAEVIVVSEVLVSVVVLVSEALLQANKKPADVRIKKKLFMLLNLRLKDC